MSDSAIIAAVSYCVGPICRNDVHYSTTLVDHVIFVEADFDDDVVIDVSVTSRNNGNADDDVRDQWGHSTRHRHDNDRGMINGLWLL